MGHPSLSQVTEGRGIPEASQVRDTEFFSTTLTFSGASWFPRMLGGAVKQSSKNENGMGGSWYGSSTRFLKAYFECNKFSLFWPAHSRVKN